MKKFVFFSSQVLLSLQYWSSCDTCVKVSSDNIDYQTNVTSIYLVESGKKPKSFKRIE